ncbi:MAG: hypothetical protein IKT70_08470 [Clostridia bacterium]|nr:hypothetical protein [Clostridia bacterium]
MKKVLTICLMMVMVLSMCVPAFAASGFTNSPSGVPAPDIIGFVPSDEDCEATLNIVPYGNKFVLSGVFLEMFEKAYSDIVDNAVDLTQLNADFAKFVKDLGIDPKNLAVSDLFDLHLTGCDYHEGHYDFDIVLDADMLSHFVALLHLNKDGVWEWVSDAKVVNDGDHLSFSVEAFSPFAIVIDTNAPTTPGTPGTDDSSDDTTDDTTADTTDAPKTDDTTDKAPDAPQTGDNNMMGVYIAVMIISVLAIVVISIKSKKQTV